MSNKILVFQHASGEGLGSFGDEMKKANIPWETLMISNDAVFPSSVKLEEYGAFIALGGPMGVYEERRYPWIQKEILVIQEILRQKKPFLGICLGAQMLAKAVGARVYPGNKLEIGWHPIRLDDWFFKRNPLFFQIDSTKPQMVFHWHSDTFDIPTEGYRLAWNENYPNQAFCYQGNAVGIQFHVEMTETMIRDWFSDDTARIKTLAAGGDPDRLIADMSKYLPGLQEMSRKVFCGFASLIRENRKKAA